MTRTASTASAASTTPSAASAAVVEAHPALDALDFVRMYLAQTDLRPGQGHAVESHACRRQRPSGLPKDSTYRCTRCDGEALLRATKH